MEPLCCLTRIELDITVKSCSLFDEIKRIDRRYIPIALNDKLGIVTKPVIRLIFILDEVFVINDPKQL